MKNQILTFVLSIALLFFFTSTLTFSQKRAVRYLKQHNSPFVKANLEKTEKMLLKAIANDSSNMKLSAVQSMRQIEQIFPDEAFNSFIEPLIEIIKDENNGTQLRITAAIVLDELHSDLGDKAIYELSKNCPDESIKNISTALSIESLKIDQKRLDKNQ